MTQFLKSQQQAVRNSLRLQDKELNIMTDQGNVTSNSIQMRLLVYEKHRTEYELHRQWFLNAQSYKKSLEKENLNLPFALARF